MKNLTGKRCVVFGVALDSSICWPIATRIAESGGEVVLVSHPATKKHVDKLAAGAGMPEPLYCDVEDEMAVNAVFERLATDGKPIHGIVHGIAYSDRRELRGRFIDTSRSNFHQSMNISCFSLVDIAKRGLPLMKAGGSIITLTFEASLKPYPHYNVMGVVKAALESTMRVLAYELGEWNIVVNAISASPEETPSARVIGDFRRIGDYAEAMSLMGRRATLDEIADGAEFLLRATGVTGQILFVDCGSSVPGMPHPRHARKMSEAMGLIADRYEELVRNGTGTKE